MAYLKPQTPLQNDDDYVYPITTADQVIATDGTHRLNNELDEIREEIAIIESSSTSSHVYAVGEFLIYNGILYRVTSSIAVGNTLTPGTNIIATNVGTELTSLKTTDTSLQSALSTETSTRASADTNLQTQINQIIAPSGEAPSAAEIENARIGADGVTYATLGEAIRTNDSDLKSQIDLIGEWADEISGREQTVITLDFQNKTGFWKKDKTFATYSTYQVRGASVSVTEGEEYLLTSASYYEMARVAFFDSGNNILSVVWTSNDNALHTNTLIRTPSNASSMLIQAVGNAYQNAKLIKLGDYITLVKDASVSHGIFILEDIIDDNFMPSYTDISSDLVFENKTGYYDKDGGFSTYSNIKGATVTVQEGEKYLLTSYSFYSMARAVFFDSADNFISSVYSSNDSALNTDTEVNVPHLAVSMLIQRNGTSEVILKKMTGLDVKHEGVQVSSILNGKKITVIGDSITEHNWRAATNWVMYIEDWTGATVQNLGASGTGFVKQSPYINRISNIQSNPDIIGVALSWNDMSAGLPVGETSDTGTLSLCGYANDFFDALITAFPNVPVICYVQNVWSAYRYGVANSDSWFDKLSEICALKGVPFYGDMYKGSVLRPWNTTNRARYFTSDGEGHEPTANTEHPNSNGHKAIARYLYPKFAENVVATGLDYIVM